MILKNYTHFGGAHSEFAALQHVLTYQGINQPGSNRPFSEAMLFGIGAGIGAAYFSFEYEGYPPTLFIGVTGRYRAKYGTVLQRACTRLGLTAQLKQSKSNAAAAKQLNEALAGGQPAIIWTMKTALPYRAVQEQEEASENALVVFGWAEDHVYLAERAPGPLQISPHEVEALRTAYGPLRNLAMFVDTDGRVNDLAGAIRTGLQETATPMAAPPAPKSNFGLPGMRKWADLLTSSAKKGWAQVFPRETYLFDALATTFSHIELIAAGGGAMRGLYADFLDEAGAILGQSSLQAVAEQYRTAGAAWTALAETALADEVSSFADYKRFAREKEALFLTQGAASFAQRQALNVEQNEIAKAVRHAFPLTAAETADLLAAMRDQVLQVHELETAALEALKAELAE